MRCDLEDLFRGVAEDVPSSIDLGEEFIFSASTLPVPPTRLRTGALVVHRGKHQYGDYYLTDVLHFQAEKCTYECLGLLILAVLFHPDPKQVTVELAHPSSEIRRLIVEYEHPTPDPAHGGYSTLPYALAYSPQETERHPYSNQNLDPWDLPCLYLVEAEPHSPARTETDIRDTARGFGTDSGSVLLATLLLDASRPDNVVDEYELEGELGFRGVGPGSVELRLWLPGSIGYSDI